MEENEMFMQCLSISVVNGKGVWNNRKNEKIWKNCFGEIGGVLYSMKNNKNKKTMVIIWVHIEKREYGVHKL